MHIFCPYFEGEVELTPERKDHIISHHPELIPTYFDKIKETIESPDIIRSSKHSVNTRLFSRYFYDVKGGKSIVVVVVSDDSVLRHWIITAYLTSNTPGGNIEWKKS